jgi:hypothetical protein
MATDHELTLLAARASFREVVPNKHGKPDRVYVLAGRRVVRFDPLNDDSDALFMMLCTGIVPNTIHAAVLGTAAGLRRAIVQGLVDEMLASEKLSATPDTSKRLQRDCREVAV